MVAPASRVPRLGVRFVPSKQSVGTPIGTAGTAVLAIPIAEFARPSLRPQACRLPTRLG